MDYQSLRDEITNDPAQLGYAALLSSGSDAGIPGALNALGSARLSLGIVTKSYFLAQFAAQIMAILSDSNLSTQFAPLLSLLNLTDTIDYSLPFVQQALGGMIGIAGLTTDGLTALMTRPCSRAETLFGAHTLISASDVAQAMKAGS